MDDSVFLYNICLWNPEMDEILLLWDAAINYCLKLIIYYVRKARLSDGERFTLNIVNRILWDYQCKRHTVYTDNYYASLKLEKKLLSHQTDLVKTTRKSSRGFITSITFVLFKVKIPNWRMTMVLSSVDSLTKGTYTLFQLSQLEIKLIYKLADLIMTSRKLKSAMLLNYSKYMGWVDKLVINSPVYLTDKCIINKMYTACITWIYNNKKTEFINNIKFLKMTKYFCRFKVIKKYLLFCQVKKYIL